MELYATTGGDNWNRSSGWGSSESPCEWYGVRCQQIYEDNGLHSNINGISLDINGLNGTIPKSLSKLPDLEYLDLGWNELKGVIPPEIVSLKKLKRLNLAGNQLEGEVPEDILARWDSYDLYFRGDGNAFLNLVVRARLEVVASGVLCSEDEDVRYALDARESGITRFESVRCTPGTDRSTHCLVREGHLFHLGRFSRALSMLKFSSMPQEYSRSDIFFVTHGEYVKTTVWWGDGSTHTLESYNREGTLDRWLAQQLFFSLTAEVR